MSAAPQTIKLSDYKPSDYFIETTDLSFNLEPTNTVVKSKLKMSANAETNASASAPLILNGENMELNSLKINGEEVSKENYAVDEKTLTIHNVPAEFTLETEVKINPQENLSLAGLYVSNGMLSTQCEAEGFRKITYYLDRPDVMSKFTVYMEADKKDYPVLLSNGNNIEKGELQNGRHFARWEDPHLKPCYLFALVAGDLKCMSDTFTTMNGKVVDLHIYVEEKDLDKIDHAMLSLKQSFAWDEKVYNREYDLGIFNIVAVSHFNMGAMENKSLNIFNTSCVLANKDMSTDAGHDRVRDVIAHEYFHNWSGNRVTCRDWHQLSLKEGFTVYRDSTFNADHGSPVVKRIEDATYLRTHQFKEDAGPTAHAVLPAEVQAFDNFYTLTIYEKGAEIIRMYRTLLGDENFFKGANLYFDRHDGQAVTIEEFCKAMEDISGKDLSQFRLWYHQAATPHVELSGDYDAEAKTFTLKAKQTCRSTPETTNKKPFLIPISLGLLDENGNDMLRKVVEMTDVEQTFVFENVASKPVPSLFRMFSAPVNYSYPYTREELTFLMANDTDGFNRWDASQQLAEGMLLDIIAGKASKLDDSLIEAFRSVLSDKALDQAMVAEMLTLPSEAELSLKLSEIDPDKVYQTLKGARLQIASALESELLEVYTSTTAEGEYDLSVESKARRALHNVALSYLCKIEDGVHLPLASEQYKSVDNMTEKQAAFTQLVHSTDETAKNEAVSDFFETYKDNQLIVNTWFSIQVGTKEGNALETAKSLQNHPSYDAKSPNDVRSVVGAFAGNSIHFHKRDGSGYEFLANQIIGYQKSNPQLAARLVSPFGTWRKYDANRQSLIESQLKRIIAVEGLSTNVYELVEKTLNVK